MMTTFNPLKQLILARLREFTREPAAVFWVYGFPLIMILALGIAFRSEPIEVVHVGVEEGESATTLLGSLEESERFNAVVVSATDAVGLLRTSKIEVLVRGVSEESTGELVMEYQFDPSRPGSLLARNAVDDYMQRAAGRKDVLEIRDIEVREAGSRYVDFLVPGLIGMSLMGGGMWGV
ncbi:MAG: ABC transporter permease, partial [Planctomycetota bacterium]|nr:ABC transporter permease [Planctomycetota bacterium]